MLASSRAQAQDDTGSPPLPPPSQPAPPQPPPPQMLPPPNSIEPARGTPPPPPREHELRDNVIGYYSGLQLGIAPGLFYSTTTKKLGFALGVSVGYGIDLDDIIVLIPSLHTNVIFAPGDTIVAGMPSLGAVLPIGPVGIRVEGGAGPGYSSAADKTAFAWRVLGAISVHPTPRLAFGAGVQYTAITAANVSLIGPILILSF